MSAAPSVLVVDGQPNERVVLKGSKCIAATRADTKNVEIVDIEDADVAVCQAELVDAVLMEQLSVVGWIVY